jgi:epoxyqueuosine reductase
MSGYGEKLANRIERFPESEKFLGRFAGYADPTVQYPWAKSIVICSWRYGVYRVPENFSGRIGKAYLSDGRKNPDAEVWHASAALESYMRDDLCLRATSGHDTSGVAYRWAALASGIGTIRRNNFFYGDHGSYYRLSAFLTDAKLEYIHSSSSKPCSDNCDKCVKNCPTRCLEAPYAMSPMKCVSFLTTKMQDDDIFEKYREEIGGWIYGCDICQDVCPRNSGTLTGEREFSGLGELAVEFLPERIATMNYDYLRNVLAPKFWYIAPEDVWMWKRNALNAMRNKWDTNYEASVRQATRDEDERVRVAAAKLIAEIGA